MTETVAVEQGVKPGDEFLDRKTGTMVVVKRVATYTLHRAAKVPQGAEFVRTYTPIPKTVVVLETGGIFDLDKFKRRFQ